MCLITSFGTVFGMYFTLGGCCWSWKEICSLLWKYFTLGGCCSLECRLFRWFKFTLKLPYTIMCWHLLSAIWGTSHWIFFVKLGLKTAWDISWHLMTNFEIFQLLATPGPFEYFWQNWMSSENQFFLDEGVTRLGGFSHLSPSQASLIACLGHFPLDFFCQIWTQDSLRHLLWHLMTNFEICQLLGGQVPRLYGGTIFWGVWHTWGGLVGHWKQKLCFLTHLRQLRGYSALTDLIKNQSIDVS